MNFEEIEARMHAQMAKEIGGMPYQNAIVFDQQPSGSNERLHYMYSKFKTDPGGFGGEHFYPRPPQALRRIR